MASRWLWSVRSVLAIPVDLFTKNVAHRGSQRLKQGNLRGYQMTVNEFAKRLAKHESGKKEVDIAQIKEVLRLINNMFNGWLYRQIRRMK